MLEMLLAKLGIPLEEAQRSYAGEGCESLAAGWSNGRGAGCGHLWAPVPALQPLLDCAARVLTPPPAPPPRCACCAQTTWRRGTARPCRRSWRRTPPPSAWATSPSSPSSCRWGAGCGGGEQGQACMAGVEQTWRPTAARRTPPEHPTPLTGAPAPPHLCPLPWARLQDGLKRCVNAVDLVHAATALLECGSRKGPASNFGDHVDKFWCALVGVRETWTWRVVREMGQKAGSQAGGTWGASTWRWRAGCRSGAPAHACLPLPCAREQARVPRAELGRRRGRAAARAGAGQKGAAGADQR